MGKPVHELVRAERLLVEAVRSIRLLGSVEPSERVPLFTFTLGGYDGLMIYANHTKIAPEQEKALLDFVASGKGFIPIQRNLSETGDALNQFIRHESSALFAVLAGCAPGKYLGQDLVEA